MRRRLSALSFFATAVRMSRVNSSSGFAGSILVPLAVVMADLVDFLIASLLLIPLFVLYRVPLSALALLFPVLVLAEVLIALGLGIWLAALDVRYRDVRYVIRYLIQLMMFTTPVIYPATIVVRRFHQWFWINPMSSIVEGFRWALLHGRPPDPQAVLISAVVTVLLLVSGLYFFARTERSFADLV